MIIYGDICFCLSIMCQLSDSCICSIHVYLSSQEDVFSLLSCKIKAYLYFFQCDPEEKGSCDSGCNGGLMNSAFEYTLKSGGLMKEQDYPYTGTDRGTCKFDKSKIAASVANFSVVSLDEEQIAANLVKNGPLAGKNIQPSFLKFHYFL